MTKQPAIIIMLDRRLLRPLIAVMIVTACALTLSSEQLTMTATYPSPVGIYNYIITTGGTASSPINTILARNAGKVGIGTATPAVKLDVDGVIHATGDVCTDAGGGRCLSSGGYPACDSTMPESITNKPCSLPMYRCPPRTLAGSANGLTGGAWANWGCQGQFQMDPQCIVIVHGDSSEERQAYPCSPVGKYLVTP